MPYLPQDRREPLLTGNIIPETGGDLNFLVSIHYNDHLRKHGLQYASINTLRGETEMIIFDLQRFFRDGAEPLHETPSITYMKIKTYAMDMYKNARNVIGLDREIIGGIANAWSEFYERVAKPYEFPKAVKNGDVYDEEFTTGWLGPRPQ